MRYADELKDAGDEAEDDAEEEEVPRPLAHASPIPLAFRARLQTLVPKPPNVRPPVKLLMGAGNEPPKSPPVPKFDWAPTMPRRPPFARPPRRWNNEW